MYNKLKFKMSVKPSAMQKPKMQPTVKVKMMKPKAK